MTEQEIQEMKTEYYSQILSLERELKEEKAKSEELKKQIEVLKDTMELIKSKLSRKGNGKPRNNKTTDEEVMKLREEGKTVRQIIAITNLSSATVVKILKGFKSDG